MHRRVLWITEAPILNSLTQIVAARASLVPCKVMERKRSMGVYAKVANSNCSQFAKKVR